MSDRVETVPLHETTRRRYLNYALSVITSRALPDVRDGLKPVQRRILFGMSKLGLSADARYRKSAQVVGEVMGKYHPHGDTAIYDAMVRMAQAFSLRYPLVDGHGNFGSLDGDAAAAMRYTEAKLTPLAAELLEDLSDAIVAFRPNYDGTLQEPTVLPATLPNLLINGATGIAVGMATNIPPHNAREVLDACIAMVDAPDVDLDALLALMPAPDFPMGGRILNTPAELREVYAQGQGAIEVRGEFEVERDGRQQQIVIRSLPYMVNKAQLIERVAEHIRDDKVPQLVDVRDESTDEVRVVLELRQGASAEVAMAYLFKHTPLQSRFHVNLTCLVPGGEEADACAPRRLGLRETLRYFLDFRHEVITRRLRQELEALMRRVHLLEGYAFVFDDLDLALEVLRGARSRSEATEALCARLDLDADQAHAVLELPLYRLASLEIDAVVRELESKQARRAQLESLLADPTRRWTMVRDELEAARARCGDRRRTVVGGPDEVLEYSQEAYIIDEDVFVIVTRGGWIKRQRSYTDLSTIRVREGDALGWVMRASTRRSLILFTDRGRAYTLRVDDVPSTTGYGEPIQARFDFADGERLVGAIIHDARVLPPIEAAEAGDDDDVPPPHLVAISRQGYGVRMGLEAFEAPSTVNGRLFMRLQSDDPAEDHVVGVEVSGGGEWVALASRESRAMTTWVEEVSVLKGPGKGVRVLTLIDDDEVIGFALPYDHTQGLEVETQRGRRVLISPHAYAPVKRGALGRLILKREKLTAAVRYPTELRGEEEGGAEGEAGEEGEADAPRRGGANGSSGGAAPGNRDLFH